MQAYVEGGRSGSNELLRPLFHELATICGYVGPDLFAGPIQLFYDWHAENGPALGLRAGELRIDLEGSTASARINWTTGPATVSPTSSPWSGSMAAGRS
jgi:hypothetical protein